MQYLYGAIVFIHLVACLLDQKIVKKITKPLLMPLLFITLRLMGDIPPLVGGALLFGFLGDVLLISDKQVAFLAGLRSFALGHILYGIMMFQGLHNYSGSKLVLAAALAFFAGIAIFRSIRVLVPADLKIPVASYTAVVFGMWAMGFLYLFYGQSSFRGLVFLSAGLFLLSDLLLSMELFRSKTKYGYFLVMLFYIAAQTGLAYGLCF